MLTELPIELKLQLFRHMAKHDIALMCRVARDWQACGDRVLYRNINFDFNPQNWNQLLQPLRRLVRAAGLAAAVVCLRISTAASCTSTSCDLCERDGTCKRTCPGPFPSDQFSDGRANGDLFLSVQELHALSVHDQFACPHMVQDNLVALWALLSMIVQNTTNLECLELPSAVPLGGIDINVIHAAMQLSQLRQLQLPGTCVPSLTKLACEPSIRAFPACRNLVVCIGGRISQNDNVPEAVSQLASVPGIFPLVLQHHCLQIWPYALSSHEEITPYVRAVRAFLEELILRHIHTGRYGRGIIWRIGLSLWQAARLVDIVEILSPEFSARISALEVEFKPATADGDELPVLTAKCMIDAVQKLPSLHTIHIRWDPTMATHVEPVVQITADQVLHEARSRRLTTLTSVRL